MRSSNMAILKSLSFTGSYFFTFMLLQICFIFRAIHGKDTNKYSRIQVFNNFEIIKLNWVGVSRLIEKIDLSRTRINNVGLNELMGMIIIFMTFYLKHCWFLKLYFFQIWGKPSLFSLKLSAKMTYLFFLLSWYL